MQRLLSRRLDFTPLIHKPKPLLATMSTPNSTQLKRASTRDESVSPPPTKRRAVANTTDKAVKNFFTPTSKKEPEQTSWRTVNNSLLVGKFEPSDPSRVHPIGRPSKIAAFDFDSTLIATQGKHKFAKDAADWKWWAPVVPETLQRLHSEGYLLAIVSNQGGLSLDPKSKTIKMDQKRLGDFKQKVGVVLGHIDLPVSIYAATSKDIYRKPRAGMWREILTDHGLEGPDSVDLSQSYFVGDAGGRQATAATGSQKDFSCSDRDFAENVGIHFHTPEEFFLNEAVQPYLRTFDPSRYLSVAPEVEARTDQSSIAFTKKNPVDIVLFVGSPGSGKSTFYWTHLEPLGYHRVNQDTLKTRDKCLKVASEHISNGTPVVVDNTNADVETRAHWTKLAEKNSVPIRCVVFTASAKLCEHNDTVRALSHTLERNADGVMNPENRSMLPKLAFTGFASRYREPSMKEGFQDMVKVDFKFEGTEEQKEIWTKYWI